MVVVTRMRMVMVIFEVCCCQQLLHVKDHDANKEYRA